MPRMHAAASQLLVIDLQTRLMPAIDRGDQVARNAATLITAARRLAVPLLFTEQNPRGLGPTLPELAPAPEDTIEKMTFDALACPALPARLAPARTVIVCGCEAHICVTQSVLGLRDAGYRVQVVADAVGSRAPENRTRALDRMARNGAGIVTTEMVLFEWLESAEHPAFHDLRRLIR
ncbi:hydrolase [Phaeovulum vinaykumarii]|uniref:Nicotinamidase-related amidase n=1 Tax=Phaeovulum vinaykumarii TaxID=407234 RepID=A0A1N7L9E5_9RHOB|nr:hydrolase [Phaeovulum vinaykumarii]SIS70456.1 Nicotinamidase-related amidase [Phaeovulum vinaykumarii]SOB98897.1 nicotinamidase-related amidase [Phaeovulum vinaykumarii]